MKFVLTLLCFLSVLVSRAEVPSDTSIKEFLKSVDYKATTPKASDVMHANFAVITKKASDADLPQKQKEFISELDKITIQMIDQIFSWENIEPKYIAFFRANFTQEEINDMTTFFNSKGGKAFSAKSKLISEFQQATFKAAAQEAIAQIRGTQKSLMKNSEGSSNKETP